MNDFALIKNGVVEAVGRHPATAAAFGAEPDGDVLEFSAGTAVAGMLWDGQALSNPPPPPAPRRLIAKSVVQERVNDVGKLGLAFTALQADPISFGRWFAPDWPNVYFDDEGLLALLAAIGCTSEEIAVITA